MSEGKTAQQKKFYKFEDRRGGRGGGRGVGGGGGRGGGRGRGGGGGGGRGGGRGRGGGGGAPSGPWHSTEGGSGLSHLGRYRDDPLPDLITATGMIVTAVQNKEKTAERELVEALEGIADELYPETIVKEEQGDEEGEMDMEAMLKKELSGISSDTKSNRIRLCRHDTPCLFYINLLPPLDPVKMVEHLLRRIQKSAKCPFKFVSRVIPISATSTATLKNLQSISESIIKEGFSTPDNKPLKFGVVVNTRNSHKLDRLEMIKTVAENVEALKGGHSVDLKNPDRTIVIEVNKNTLGVSVLQDYDVLKKYNVVEIAKAAAVAAGKTAASATASTESTGEAQEQVINRAAVDTTTSTEKRKAEEMGDGMDVDSTKEDEEDRAAKQAKVDEE